jgi:hypothetical protein
VIALPEGLDPQVPQRQGEGPIVVDLPADLDTLLEGNPRRHMVSPGQGGDAQRAQRYAEAKGVFPSRNRSTLSSARGRANAAPGPTIACLLLPARAPRSLPTESAPCPDLLASRPETPAGERIGPGRAPPRPPARSRIASAPSSHLRHSLQYSR